MFHETRSAAVGKVIRAFQERGFGNYSQHKLGSYGLILFSKILIHDQQVIQQNSSLLAVCGTMVYKGQGPSESAKTLLHDLTRDMLDEECLIGHFIVIAHISGRIFFLTDRLCTLSLYYHEDKLEYSSSFIALMTSSQGILTINKHAMFEILFVNGVVPPDTQVDQIKRWTPAINNGLSSDVSVYKYRTSHLFTDFDSSLNRALDNQIERLDAYFEMSKTLFDEFGAVMGLTGGFDSRLLLAMMIRHKVDTEFYTHWQKGVSKDYQIAHEIASAFDIELDVLRKHYQPGGSDFTQGYQYTDGQIRHQYYWSEAYSTVSYYNSLIKVNKVGINGVGGEQYRNSEGFPRRKEPVSTWLRRDAFSLQANCILKSSRDHEIFIERVCDKIKCLLAPEIEHASPYFAKRYYNEIYGYSNRYFRAGFENQIMYHLSPFSDPYNSLYAYRAIPFLGGLYSFQMEMLKRLNVKLASCRSSYGFSFDKNVPLLYRLGKLMQRRISNRNSTRIKMVLSEVRRSNACTKYDGSIPAILEGIDFVRSKFSRATNELIMQISFFEQIVEKLNRGDE